MNTTGDRRWPVLRRYDRAHLDEISLPIGGIGTGTLGFGGRGQLRDFELGGRPARGFRPDTALFAIRVHPDGGAPIARVLEGPIGEREYGGKVGSVAANHGLPRFADATFETAYPFGRVVLNDPALPTVRIGAFNPFVPGDVEASSWPIGVFRVDLTNTLDRPIEVSIAAALENFLGDDFLTIPEGHYRNEFLRSEGVAGVRMTVPGQPDSVHSGEFVLGMIDDARSEITARTGWSDPAWSGSLVDFWDDFVQDGRLQERSTPGVRPVASLCATVSLQPGERHEASFLFSWSFPNRKAWSADATIHYDDRAYTDDSIGNYYAVKRPDAWRTALDAVRALPQLEERSILAIDALVRSPVPAPIIEAALFNLSTLRSQTLFRTSEGRFYGWEGVLDRSGSCFGNCTHVWGYEFATSFLFPEIAWSFRSTQYERATDERGHMSFRAGLPVDHSRDWQTAAADGQMASLVRLYVDWRLSGNDESLRELWPSARRSLEFAWIPGGWDEDHDGVMEGCQHNTMDVEFYGPHPQMTGWYLAALKACAEMAEALGESDFAERCRTLFASGSALVDDQLFTGTHYRQLVKPLAAGQTVAPGLRMNLGAADPAHPDLQLGEGVLVDQLVGQYAARVAGLGGLLEQEHVTRALRTVFKRNFRTEFRTAFNPMRSFVLGDESGLVMCSYDGVPRPARPFPYYAEVMTGFEYVAATSMIYEGLRDEGLRVIEAVRNRFDGAKRDPFDEPELGHHYARAMASWSAFIAWLGFDYDGRTGRIAFGLDSPATRTFWSTGSAWGIWARESDHGELHVHEGRLLVRSVSVGGAVHELGEERTLAAGNSVRVELPRV